MTTPQDDSSTDTSPDTTPDTTSDTTPEEQEWLSKTALKQEMHELQQLGAAIVKLSDGQLATIPIEDEALAEAIATARRIKHREGLRRQMQYIGKLMRKIDAEPLRAAYQKLQDGHKEKARRLHELEQWRDQLLAQGQAAIGEALTRFPNADRQHLRQLIMQANKEQQHNKPPASARKLFRYLRELLEQQEEN